MEYNLRDASNDLFLFYIAYSWLPYTNIEQLL